jgi:predicted DNA binding protein
MSVIATFYLETPVLQRALSDVPEMSVSVEQQTATDTSPTTMIFWAGGDDFSTFESGIEDDPTVTDPSVLSKVDGKRLYKLHLTDEGEEVITYQSWAELGAVFLSAERSGDAWTVQLRFSDRDSLQQYVDFCRERGLTLDLREIHSANEKTGDSRALTDVQRDTLLTAVESGYFSVPREASAEDLAEELGVSHQAVSERLRRATESLVRETIGSPTDDRSDE